MALALGRTVDELLDSITAEEFDAWRLYYNHEPFGFEREDYHAALVAMTVANMAGKSLKGSASITEFMHNHGNVDEEELSEEQQFAIFNHLLGGKNVKK